MEQLALVGKEFFYENVIAFNGFSEFMALSRTNSHMNTFLSHNFFTKKDDKRSKDDTNRYRNGLVREKFQNHIYYIDGTQTNGLYREFNRKKFITLRCFYLHDLKHGIHETFNDQGKLLTQKRYRDGKLNGKYRRYKDGNISTETTYINDRNQGRSLQYYDNGNVKSECYYDILLLNGLKKDELHGNYSEYHDNGKIRVVGTYDYGMKIGKWKHYDDKGLTIKTEKFSKQVIVNRITIIYNEIKRYENNRKISCHHTMNGTLHGSSTDYYLNGLVKRYDNYYNGLLNGMSRQFEQNGSIKRETTYRMGLMDGYHKEFSNGILTVECQYSNSQLHGRYIVYQNDKISSIQNYNHGKTI